MKIVIDDKIPFVQGVFEPFAEVVYAPGSEINADMVKGADALMVRTRTMCDAALLQGSNVKMIATATIGFDHIDTAYCASQGIEWVNAPGCNAYAVVQYVFAALAELTIKEGVDISSKTLGIVGVGNVGKRLAAFAQKIGMKVLLNDPPRAKQEGDAGFVSLQTIQEEADIITFHTPLNRDGEFPTYHLCDEVFISQLKRHPILINAARGEIVDNLSLVKYHASLKALVIDCWENEPNINLDLLNIVDIATFHIAGYSMEGKANAAIASVRAISRFLNLQLNDWSVTLPEKDVNDVTSLSMLETVHHSYDVKQDDAAFRMHPEHFEQLRGAYSYRREPDILY